MYRIQDQPAGRKGLGTVSIAVSVTITVSMGQHHIDYSWYYLSGISLAFTSMAWHDILFTHLNTQPPSGNQEQGDATTTTYASAGTGPRPRAHLHL